MYHVDQKERKIDFTMSSNLDYIDRLIEDSSHFVMEHDLQADHKFRICLRELLLNAIEHGNQNDSGKKVECHISLFKNKIEINIKDEGKGFDYSKINKTLHSTPEDERNRGFPIIYDIVDSVQFNETGSSIIVSLDLAPRENLSFIIKENKIPVEIIPRISLTASSAENLRKVLINLFDKGYDQYILDFSNVQEIDSICIAVLLSFGKMLRENKKDDVLVITHCNKEIMALIQVMGFKQFYQIGDESEH